MVNARGARVRSAPMAAHRLRRPATTTVAAAGLMALVAAGFVVYAVLAVAGLDSDMTASRDAVLLGLSGRDEDAATLAVAVVIGAFTLLTAVLCHGVLRRRQGARHAAMVTFGVLALVSLATGLAGLQAVPPGRNAWYAVLVGVLDAAVVVLLLLPVTADDFELAERARDRAASRV